jgi:4-aminobutyrate aminotransferase-like enzyme
MTDFPAVPDRSAEALRAMASAQAAPFGDESLARWQRALDLHQRQGSEPRLDALVLGARGSSVFLVRCVGPARGRVVEVLDLSGQWGTCLVGHGNERVAAALDRTSRAGATSHDDVGDLERAAFLDAVLGPSGTFGRELRVPVQVCGRSTGSEAVEAALRMAWDRWYDFGSRRWEDPRRVHTLSFHGAWHGWTGQAGPLSHRPTQSVAMPEPSERSRGRPLAAPYGRIDALERIFREHGRAIGVAIVEPLQGDGGVVVPEPGFLERFVELCREHEVVSIFDEVMTFGRGRGFFAMREDGGALHADLRLVGKGLGNGVVPIALVIVSSALSAPLGRLGSTHDLRPAQCAVAAAVCEAVAAAQQRNAPARIETDARDALADLVSAHPSVFRAARGTGALWGIELAGTVDPAELRARCLDHGVLVDVLTGRAGRTGRTVLVAPPLDVDRAHFLAALERLGRAAAALEPRDGRL